MVWSVAVAIPSELVSIAIVSAGRTLMSLELDGVLKRVRVGCAASEHYLVIRPCHLALRRAVGAVGGAEAHRPGGRGRC